MTKSRAVSLSQFTPLPLLALLLCGCATPAGKGTTATEDRAFIEYWPPPKGSTKPRLAVKDLIDMKGKVTSAGSQYFLKHGLPAERDAVCLRGARGRVDIVGKTNLTEFAISPSGANSYFGMPENQVARSRHRISGGSSSGSAVALANREADIAFGTDTAGSIRLPAACCGIFGLKTTFGRISTKGVYPISAKYLDTVGPMARDIPGLVLGMDLLEPGFHGEYEAAVAAKPRARQIRVGQLYVEGTRPDMDDAVDAALRAHGFKVVRLSKAFSDAWKEADDNAQIVAHSAAWLQNNQLQDQPEVSALSKLIIASGKLTYDQNYGDALKGRKPWQATLRRAFREVDVIALPTVKTIPPLIRPVDGVLFESWILSLQNTAAVNFAGNPAIAVPIPIENHKMPGSIEFIGPMNSEAQLLNVGRLISTRVK